MIERICHAISTCDPRSPEVARRCANLVTKSVNSPYNRATRASSGYRGGDQGILGMRCRSISRHLGDELPWFLGILRSVQTRKDLLRSPATVEIV